MAPYAQAAEYEAVIVGAGFSGMYMLHKLRQAGMKVKVFEAAADVGGTWYWNRYPGARCDSESYYYCYTFSEELYKEWTWTTRYPTQPEILQYLNFVADRLDLRRDIQFNTRVLSAHYDEDRRQWLIRTEDGAVARAQFLITAVGCLSVAHTPDFPGLESFTGEWYHTGLWPHHPVSFRGKRVGVIGTGSSAAQAIPVIAGEAEHLYVFQRTPQYVVPARHQTYDEAFIRKTKENFHQLRERLKHTHAGFPFTPNQRLAQEDSPEERQRRFEKAWEIGGLAFFNSSYRNLMTDREANQMAADFVRSKIREIVRDPELAAKLLPTYYFGAKRLVVASNYYETYNRDNVTLVDIQSSPITAITPKGLKTTDKAYELDTIVFATGFDAMTGPLFRMDIRGKNGLSLREKWADGALIQTYLGLTTSGFPNLFTITGPESPSVLTNMPVSIQQHVEWIADCIQYLRERKLYSIEPTPEAETSWSQHCQEVANATLYPLTESWYTGANIPGKPRRFPIYLGGVGVYRQKCDEVAQRGYAGFQLA